MNRFKILFLVLTFSLFASAPLHADECISSGLIASSKAFLTTPAGHFICALLILTDGSNAATVTAYDNATAGGGTVLFKGVVPGASNFGMQIPGHIIRMVNGLYVTISGTGANAIVYYK